MQNGLVALIVATALSGLLSYFLWWQFLFEVYDAPQKVLLFVICNISTYLTIDLVLALKDWK